MVAQARREEHSTVQKSHKKKHQSQPHRSTSPRLPTRISGAKRRDEAEAGSKPIRMATGEEDGMGQASTHGTAPATSPIGGLWPRRGNPAPAIDASHRHRRHHEASSPRPQIRHRPARRHEERGGERREAIRYERRSERQSGKQREARPHDERITGRVSTMGQTEATPNTDDETTSPTRQASRNERDTRRTAEAPRQRE